MVDHVPICFLPALMRDRISGVGPFVEIVESPVEAVQAKMNVAPVGREQPHAVFRAADKLIAQVASVGRNVVLVQGIQPSRLNGKAIVPARTQHQLVKPLAFRTRK